MDNSKAGMVKRSTLKDPKLETGYVPSISSYEGEILVKGKTLGRWSSKKFILDAEQFLFVLLHTKSKKKPKIIELKKYVITNQEKKKERYQFDLEPMALGQVKYSLGHINEKFINQVINTLLSCCYKADAVETKVANVIRPQGQRKSIFIEKQIQSESGESQVPEEEDDEFQPRTILPDHFNTNEIINNLQDNYQEDQFELFKEQDGLKLWRHKKNLLLFKASLQFTQNELTDLALYHLLNSFDYIKKWNSFVTPISRVLRPITEERAQLVHEQRLYVNIFPFPREFVYLRHSMIFNDKMYILDRAVDAIDVRTQIIKGQTRHAVWKIIKNDKYWRVVVIMEATNQGLTYPDEDGYLTSKYLEQLINLNEYINQNIQTLLEDEQLKINPFEEKQSKVKQEQKIQQQVEQNEEKQFQTQKQEETLSKQTDIQDAPHQIKENGRKSKQYQDEEEFFDCDEDEAQINSKLHIEHKESLDQELGENLIQQEIQVQPPSNDVEWAKWKMNLFSSGEYNSLHIKHKWQMVPQPRASEKPSTVIVQDGQNFVYLNDWQRDDTKGGLRMINTQKINAQKKVLKFLLVRIGANILQGKSLMFVSMPVDIFEARSTLSRMCNGLGFAPILLEKASQNNDPVYRVRAAFALAFGFLMSFLGIEKPFNPILGETYQGWIDKCPIYAEQISHHPPISVIMLYGRGYKIEARLEMSANIHSNSVTGKNVGKFMVHYDCGQQVQIMLAPGLISGTAFGDRMFHFNQRTMCIDTQNQIIAEVVYQPDKKHCTNLGVKHSALTDFLCGGIYRVSDNAIQKYKNQGYRKYNGVDKNDIKEVLHKVQGRWTNEIYIDNSVLISVLNDLPSPLEHDRCPIASDTNYRMDLLWWKLRDFNQAQSNKEQMEVYQRQDKKLREKK